MSKISEVITLLSFSPLRSIQGRSSIADIFSVDKRCGIYILRFLNGEFYAGQALDVTRRYVQHRKTHNDIAEISFKQVASDSLDVAEREVIWTLEREDFHLRNIMFASIPKGESDFDFVMTVEEQKKWLDDFRYQDFGGARAQDDTLRRKYHQKFQRFSKRSSFSEAITILQRYMQQGVPVPVRSEMAF